MAEQVRMEVGTGTWEILQQFFPVSEQRLLPGKAMSAPRIAE